MIPFIDLKTQQARVRKDIEKRIHAILDHGAYIMGPELGELEERLCAFTGAKHAIVCSSGTDALLGPKLLMNLSIQDEVIVPDFTFYAAIEMAELLGAKSVFCDVDPVTFNMDVAKLESLITEKTKFIIPVSLYGQCADMDAINEIAAKHGVHVIEDAAQSFGATYKGRRSCALSTFATTSFFPAKPLGCYGDGGAIFTDSDDLAQGLREVMNHGQRGRYNHARIGINGRMDSMQAAVLLSKLEIFEDELAKREAVAARYNELLKDHVTVPVVLEEQTSAWAQYTIQVDQREQFLARMSDQGVPTSVHYPCRVSDQPILKERYPGDSGCDVAKTLSQRVVSLPMHPYLTEQDQDAVVEAVKRSIED